MLEFLSRLFRREPPLRGAPATRRQKTYSSDSGYVYQYCFEGFRNTGEAYEYVFSATANRKQWFPVAVSVANEVLTGWTEHHQRELTSSERFAVAKIALRRAFDTRISPEDLRRPVRVDAGELAEISEFLDLA